MNEEEKKDKNRKKKIKYQSIKYISKLKNNWPDIVDSGWKKDKSNN